MSGHSKWHSIKHKKAATDAKRGKIFTKHAKLITIAAREGGGEPDMNPGLRVAIENAKKDNMPNANIDRAIKKGTGADKDAAQIIEIMYEGFGPEGTAILVQCLTDNKNRSHTNVKTIFSKNGGNLGESGSVAWMFKKSGLILLPVGDKDPEELTLQAIDAGAQDVKTLKDPEGDKLEIITEPTEVAAVRTALESAGFQPESANITYLADNEVDVNDLSTAQKIIKLLDALDDDEDVGEVYSNFNIAEEIMDQL